MVELRPFLFICGARSPFSSIWLEDVRCLTMMQAVVSGATRDMGALGWIIALRTQRRP